MIHIFNKCHQHHVISLLETRVDKMHNESLVQTFKSHRRKVFSNPAIPSDLGGLAHGGECISTRSNMAAKHIDVSVLEYIKQHTNADLRFCAVYIRLTNLTFLFVNAYFWVSVGPKHPNNFCIFSRLNCCHISSNFRSFCMQTSTVFRKN